MGPFDFGTDEARSYDRREDKFDQKETYKKLEKDDRKNFERRFQIEQPDYYEDSKI